MRPVSRLKATQSKSFAKKRKEKKIMAVGLTVVNLIAWIFVLSRVSGLGFVTIDNIRVIGADADITPSLELAALGSLDGSYLHLFSRANSFLYPHRGMTAAVMAASPRVESVKVYKSDIHTVVVAVNEKQPAAVVCSGLPDLTLSTADLDASGTCYEADSTGLLFRVANASDRHEENRYFAATLGGDDHASTTDFTGTYATSTAQFARLQSFYETLRRASIPVASVLLKEDGEFEMYLRNPSAQKEDPSDDFIVVYFNDVGNLETEASNLISFWQNRFALSHTSAPTLEYIDVRYGSNIFFREAK